MQDKLSNVKFSYGSSLYNSEAFGILDFYESLSILPSVHAMILQGEAELKNDLKPAGPI
jgi:ASC-1-like (ASCH) protein